MSAEDKIIKSIINGNREAFHQLYALYADKVYNTALSYTKNKEEAEEIAQEVFVKVYLNIAKFQAKSSLSTWIYRITINISINHLRKKKQSVLFSFKKEKPENIDFEHPGVLLEKKEDAKALFRVIDHLPDTQKTAFILSYIEDLPRKEVAEIMDISLKAVESLLQRAKKKMRVELEKLYPNRKKKNT